MYEGEDLRLHRLAELFAVIPGAYRKQNISTNNPRYNEEKINCFVDVQRVWGHNDGKKLITELLLETVKELEEANGVIYWFAGVHSGGKGPADVLGGILNRPSCSIIRKNKLGEDNIKGYFEPGKNYLLLEDCTDIGIPIKECIEILREEGGYVSDAVVIVDKSESAEDVLKDIDIDLHSFLILVDLPRKF